MSNLAPVVTPSTLVIEKEQVVVIEFRREIPKSSFLTLDIYYEGSSTKFITLPTALLGPRTVRAMFPAFPKPGTVSVSVLLARDEDCRFPQFKLKVQSPIESLARALPSTTGPKQVARLAAVVAYLANCSEKDHSEATLNADEVISEIFKGLQPADLPEWTLAWFLCGKFSPAANLLHVCTQHNLSQSLDILLQPWFIEDKAHCLLQKSLDNKTPVDIAKKNNLTAVSETADQLVASGAMKLSTPKAKKKFTLKPDIPRASSIDSNMQQLVQDGSTSQAKKKGKSAKRVLRQLFKSDTKDKINISSPQHQMPDQVPANFCDANEDIHSVTLPRSYRQSFLSVSNPEADPEPGLPSGNSTYFMAGRDENAYELRQGSKTLSRLEQTSKPLEQYQQPPPPPTSWSLDRPLITEHRLRPVSSLSSGYGSAVSNAVAELKEKAIYKAEVVRQYKFVSSPSNELILEIGDKMYVTQEVEDNMCLGVCNDHYCKVPKSVLCVLTNCNNDIEEDHDYDRVIFSGESDDDDDDEGIYKIPRNVPRVADSASDSDNSDHVYDVPPNKDNILNYLIEEGHYMKVPNRNSILASVLSDNLKLGRDHDSTPHGKQPTVNHHSERETGHEHKAATVDTTALQSQTKLQDWEGEEPSNNQEDNDKDEGTDGIYDIPSSVLQSVHETSTGETLLEYNVMIPISTHSAKVADESQPKHPGWGYEETKDAVPSTATTIPSQHDHTHSTNPNRRQYMETSDTVPSKQAPFVKPVHEIEDTPDAKLACYHANDDPEGALTHSKYVNQDRCWNEKFNALLHVHSTIIDGGNEYQEDSDNEDTSGIYDVPSAVLRSIDDPVPQEPLAELSSNRRDAKRSSETSDTEETRNVDTPEGSEGSLDVFVDQLTVTSTVAQGKTNSLPPLRHQSHAGALYTTPSQKGATLDTHRYSSSRTRIASAPHVSQKPRPARRTKIIQSQERSPSHSVGKVLSQLPEIPQENPLPNKPQPPVLPEKSPPALPEKPVPTQPNQTSLPPRPEKPLLTLQKEPSPPPLPEKPPPPVTEIFQAEKPLPPLPGDPALELPVIPDKPTFDRAAPGKPSEYWDSQTTPGRTSHQSSNRTPKPKPRRVIPATKPDAEGGGNSPQIEVRSGRSHTSASCSETSVTDSFSTSPSMHQRYSTITNEGTTKAFRSARAKSASDAEINATALNVRSPQHSTDSMGATVKARVAAPPVARKPNKVSPNSSPMLALNRPEHSKPTTAPKPKRH